MTQDDLLQWQALQQDTAAHQAFLMRGLMEMRWGSDALELEGADLALLRQQLRHWLKATPLVSDAQSFDLLRARGPLRRLVTAAGDSLRSLLTDTLGTAGRIAPGSLVPEDRLKLALLADARLANDFDLLDWSRNDPVAAMVFAVQALDASPLNAAELQALNAMVKSIPQLELAPLPLVVLTPLMIACYRLSYLNAPQRYDTKKRLVEQARLVLQLHGKLPTSATPPVNRLRPRMLVIGEGLRDGNALFRFFAEPLRDMRRYFEVLLMCDQSVSVATIAELGDGAIRFATGPDPINLWTQQIREVAPDIIFYPGIGQTLPTFVLSLMRLAPTQVGSIGCPSSSYSPEIDGTLLFEQLVPPPGLPNPIRYQEHHMRATMEIPVTPARRANNQAPVRIGVNAMAVKLNDAFMSTVERIIENSPRPAQLVFMPNVAGIEFQILTHALTTRFANAEVLPSVGHADYLAALASCDLVLQSFPYGGANTTRDALELDIPVIALRSEWLSGQTDELLMSDRGLEALCCSDVEEYVSLALQLLGSGDLAKRVQTKFATTRDPNKRRPQGGVTAGDAIYAFWQALQVRNPAKQ